MTYDFSFWLMLLTVVSGLVWGADTLLFKNARMQKKAQSVDASQVEGESEKSDSPYKAAAKVASYAVLQADVTKLHDRAAASREPLLVEYARSFFPVLALVLVVRSFIFEPFRIPSESMMPTLLAGDFIFVSKFSYDLRLPVFNVKLLETGNPQRGDVVVFKLPSDPSVNYIKRLVGLPGDHIVVLNDRVFINDKPLETVMGGLYNELGYLNAQLAEETLGEVKHQVMYLSDSFPTNFDGVVPAGHYYFMGDNRDNSQDSRFPQVGYVPEANLVGRAKLIWFHWKFSELPILSRIGTRIH
ncbi:MAG: signal peptidase I [Steroidobacteraceae bacterium]